MLNSSETTSTCDSDDGTAPMTVDADTVAEPADVRPGEYGRGMERDASSVSLPEIVRERLGVERADLSDERQI